MKGILLALAASLLLTSCSCSDNRERAVRYDDSYVPQTTTPSSGTVIVHDNDNSSGLINGMILGHMLSNSGSSNNSNSGGSRRTKKTTIINNYHQTPTRRPAVRSTPSYKPSPMRTRSSMSSRSMGRRGR